MVRNAIAITGWDAQALGNYFYLNGKMEGNPNLNRCTLRGYCPIQGKISKEMTFHSRIVFAF